MKRRIRNYKRFIYPLLQREFFKENRKTCRCLLPLKSIVPAFKFQFRFACLESKSLYQIVTASKDSLYRQRKVQLRYFTKSGRYPKKFGKMISRQGSRQGGKRFSRVNGNLDRSDFAFPTTKYTRRKEENFKENPFFEEFYFLEIWICQNTFVNHFLFSLSNVRSRIAFLGITIVLSFQFEAGLRNFSQILLVGRKIIRIFNYER